MSQDAALSRYNEEQERLRRQHGSDPVEDEFDDSFIPEEPEVNPEIYRDVEPLLFKGFIHQAATIGHVNFVFKSLNHHEFEQIQLSYKLQPGFVGIQKFYATLLAHGVWMVEGQNVLPDRRENLIELTKFFEEVSGPIRERITRHLSELNRRANRAIHLTEAYAMETASRIRWNQVRGLDLMSSSTTGIEGTEKLGYNWGQLVWRALNYVDDEKMAQEAAWENSKFVASSMAGKGMNRIHARDRQRKRDEQNERRARKDKILRWAVLGEDPEEPTPERGTMIVARTVEELSKQLEKDLKGEKDWHDMVIEQHERRIQEETDQRQQYIREMHAEHVREMGDRELVGATDLRGLTREEVERRARERQRRVLERMNQPSVTLDPKVERLEEKWRNALPLSGKDPSTALPAGGVQRPRTTPWRSDS